MENYQEEFIAFALKSEAIRFGDFQLKSGRKSAYFFNAGMFTNGEALSQLAKFYAATIHHNFLNQFDLIFGPAYKGISLAVCAAIGLYNQFNLNFPISFNRKENKDHGEGGVIIGNSLKNQRILLIDDVITAGTTIRESVNLIDKEGGKLVGVVVALDRQEPASIGKSTTAIADIQAAMHSKIVSIITYADLIEFLTAHRDHKEYQKYLSLLQSPNR